MRSSKSASNRRVRATPWLPIVAVLFVSVACAPGEELIGACCDGTTCTLVTEANCGGLFVGGVCTPNPCETVGACCMVGGDCALTTQFDCDRGFLGPGTECSMCPTSAACYEEDSVCREVEAPEDCNGRPIVGEVCEPNPCEPPPPPMEAACCNGTECSVRTEEVCIAQSGAWQPGFTACDPNPCDDDGGCCLSDGSCIEVDSPDCDGIFVSGMGVASSTCDDNTCNGACCDEENQCSFGSLADCGDNDFIGPRSSCDPDPCENPVGACCRVEGCVETLRTECETLFISGVTCDPDPCPDPISVEVIELCAGVTQNDGVSSLAWSFALASTVSLAGETLTLGVEGPGDPLMANGTVDDESHVRIEDVTASAFGTYTYEVLSIGSAALAGDLDGSIVVDGSEKPCRDGSGGTGGSGGNGGSGGAGSGSPYSECVERPAGSIECDCDPFADNCSGNLECSINFFVDDEMVVESVPALDGSDCCPATECISNVIQTVGAGGGCNILLAGTLRRDDCLPGLFCDPDSEQICVPLCLENEDCADDSCELFSLTNPGFGSFGRCSVP